MEFYKRKETDKIFWGVTLDTVGKIYFTFDKKNIYEFYRDCPHNLTQEEWNIFKKERPVLAKLKDY